MHNYLESVTKQFEYYKILGEKAMAQVPEVQLAWKYNEESNSIATIVKHLGGNMLSRWTDFLISDGEKTWRNRDAEFENDITSGEEIMKRWNKGWECLLSGLKSLKDTDLDTVIYIRNQGHSVVEAINRQLAHASYHIGQIVFLARMICSKSWISLSIPKGQSEAFNAGKFSVPRHKEHFTDEYTKTIKG
jgi:Protein of unknown function (DUF1572)